MAHVRIGLGFWRTGAHEESLKRAAERLPADWEIDIAGDGGCFTVDVKRHTTQSFGPERIEDAIGFLEGLAERLSKP